MADLMTLKWIALVVLGALLPAFVKCNSIEVRCGDVDGFVGQKVSVTCTMDYSKIDEGNSRCGFQSFNINDAQVDCTQDQHAKYPCKAVLTNITEEIPNPQSGNYTFVLVTACGFRGTTFKLTLTPELPHTETPTNTVMPEATVNAVVQDPSGPSRSAPGVFIAVAVLVALVVFLVYKSKKSSGGLHENMNDDAERLPPSGVP